MLFKAAVVLTAVAVLLYRSGRIVWHHILTIPDLPQAYYTGGNWTSHCTLIQDPASDDINFCEDIAFWDHYNAHGARTDRLVLLGCDPNRKAWNTVMGPLRDPAPRGHLFLYIPRTDTVQRVTLQGYPATHDFHPLGMDIYPSHDGALSNLFIVNHARAHTTIEQFTLDPARPTEAHHLRTLHSPHFVSPNALALSGPTSFYVSNDHRMTRRLPVLGHVLPLVETLLGLPLGWVAHVVLEGDTLAHTVVAPGIPFANGLARTPAGDQLAVAATALGVVHVYNVTHASTPGALTYVQTIPVPFLPDNLAYDDAGTLLVTGHPAFPALAAVAADTRAHAPSWVVAVTPRTEADADADDTRAPLSASAIVPRTSTHVLETVFQSDGSVFGSSSTTLRDVQTGAVYIAGLYAPGVLACRPYM